MTLAPLQSDLEVPPASRRKARGFTLVEMMISLSLFSLVVVGLITVHIFGQRYDQLVLSKLGASDQSRLGFNELQEDIRSAKRWRVGVATDTAFTPVANGTAQRANGLRLHFNTNTNQFTIYYFNTNDMQLLRRRHDSAEPQVLARDLTNVTTHSMTFAAENYRGSVQTDLTQKGVIKALMEFARYQYPLTDVGPGFRYDYYKLELKATPHVPDGI
jgi:prepilin-type N-terminal cleavage/methylation domain-containing protein